MKQKKMLFIALAVLLVLIVGIVFLLKDDPNKTQQEQTTEETTRQVAFSTEQENIKKVTYQHSDEEFSIVLNGGVWVLEDEPDLPVSQPRADGVAYDFTEFNVTEVVEENAKDIQKYGLNPAQTTTTIEMKNGDAIPFYVGSKVQGENRYYVKIGADNTVYIADATQCETLLYGKQDMLALNLQTLRSDEINTVQFSHKGGESFKIKQNHDSVEQDWSFIEPSGWGIDESVLDAKLLTFVTAIEAFEYVTDKTDAELGLDNPQVTVTTEMLDGTIHTLAVGDVNAESGNVAIKVDGLKHPAIVDLQIIQLTKLTKFDIIDKTVEFVDYNDIQKVEIDGELDFVLYYGDACQLNDTAISKETAIKLYSDICELTLDANGTIVSGMPVLTISHNFKNGDNKTFKIYKQDAYNYAITLDDDAFFTINRGTYLAWKEQIETYLVTE